MPDDDMRRVTKAEKAKDAKLVADAKKQDTHPARKAAAKKHLTGGKKK